MHNSIFNDLQKNKQTKESSYNTENEQEDEKLKKTAFLYSNLVHSQGKEPGNEVACIPFEEKK